MHSHPDLGRWVSQQRQNHKKGTLSEERIRQLEEIGFEWSIRMSILEKSWDLQYEKLKAYKAKV